MNDVRNQRRPTWKKRRNVSRKGKKRRGIPPRGGKPALGKMKATGHNKLDWFDETLKNKQETGGRTCNKKTGKRDARKFNECAQKPRALNRRAASSHRAVRGRNR